MVKTNQLAAEAPLVTFVGDVLVEYGGQTLIVMDQEESEVTSQRQVADNIYSLFFQSFIFYVSTL